MKTTSITTIFNKFIDQCNEEISLQAINIYPNTYPLSFLDLDILNKGRTLHGHILSEEGALGLTFEMLALA